MKTARAPLHLHLVVVSFSEGFEFFNGHVYWQQLLIHELHLIQLVLYFVVAVALDLVVLDLLGHFLSVGEGRADEHFQLLLFRFYRLIILPLILFLALLFGFALFFAFQG